MQAIMFVWDGKERRRRKTRRRYERRRSLRYPAETLIVINGVTWVSTEGIDRRRHIRRKEDREELAKRILNSDFDGDRQTSP